MEWKKENVKSLLKLNKERLIFLFCSGLLLFILAMPMEGGRKESGSEGIQESWSSGSWSSVSDTASVGQNSAETAGQSVTVATGESQIETRVRTILSGVEGVGEVEVMVMLKPEDTTSMFEEDDTETVLGIIISADGGGSAIVKTEISEAMEALFGLPPHKIKVLKRVKKGV